MTVDNPVMTASQGRPTRGGSVLASPAQATVAMTSMHADTWQRLAGRGRGMATPSRVVETNGIGRDNSEAWPSPQLPSLNLAKAGSCHPLSSTPCRGPVLTGEGTKPGCEDVYTLPRELCSLAPSPPPLCSGGGRAESCRPGSPFGLGLVWSMGGGTRGDQRVRGAARVFRLPAFPPPSCSHRTPSGSGSCPGGPGLCTLLIPPLPLAPQPRVKVLPAGAICLTTPWLASLSLLCLSPFPAPISSG